MSAKGDVILSIKHMLYNAEDNLYRANCAHPNWRSSDGETLQQVKDAYHRDIKRLKAALALAEEKL